jgi:hypothetical protein
MFVFPVACKWVRSSLSHVANKCRNTNQKTSRMIGWVKEKVDFRVPGFRTAFLGVEFGTFDHVSEGGGAEMGSRKI